MSNYGLVGYLNKLLLLDKEAITKLFSYTVPINELMMKEEDFIHPNADFLSLINHDNKDKIVAHWSNDGKDLYYFSYVYNWAEIQKSKKDKDNLESAMSNRT